MHQKWAWSFAALSGFIVVAAGAFGAHALSNTLSPRNLEVFHTAVRYQAWHTLAPDEAAAVTDVTEFEAKALAAAGLDHPAIPPRYSSTYFAHIFAGGYDAAVKFIDNFALRKKHFHTPRFCTRAYIGQALATFLHFER